MPKSLFATFPSSDTFSQHFSGQVAAKFLTVLEAVSDCLCHAVDTNRNAINPVTAVDRTTHLLNKARTKARAARVKIEWVQKDMRDFVRPDYFPLVLSLFTSSGYFDDRQENAIVLKNIFTSLRPGGVCLIEVLGEEHLAKIFQSTTSTPLSDGTMVVQRHEIFDDWTRDSERMARHTER